MTEPIKEKLFSRKFIQSIIVAAILLVVFVLIIIFDKFNDTIFGIWVAALLANFGIYTTGNIKAKQYAPEIPEEQHEEIAPIT